RLSRPGRRDCGAAATHRPAPGRGLGSGGHRRSGAATVAGRRRDGRRRAGRGPVLRRPGYCDPRAPKRRGRGFAARVACADAGGQGPRCARRTVLRAARGRQGVRSARPRAPADTAPGDVGHGSHGAVDRRRAARVGTHAWRRPAVEAGAGAGAVTQPRAPAGRTWLRTWAFRRAITLFVVAAALALVTGRPDVALVVLPLAAGVG